MDRSFPFIPKSNSKLKPGHFWAIRLDNGNFGCGIVLDVPQDKTEFGTRIFYAGLLNWTDATKPTVESLVSASLAVLRQGAIHIKTILVQHEEILGTINLAENNLKADTLIDSSVYSNSSYVVEGFKKIRKATMHDHETLKTSSTLGYMVLINAANKLLTKQQHTT